MLITPSCSAAKARTRSIHSQGGIVGRFWQCARAILAIGSLCFTMSGQMQAQSDAVAVVSSFGAKGDGVSDDTAPLQSALSSSSSRVFVPPGMYRLTKTLRIPSNKRLTLAAGATILRASSCMAMLMNDADGRTGVYSANSNIIVEGGKWDGNGRSFAENCTLLAFGHCSDVVIRDTAIVDIPIWHGIEINAAERVTIERVQFEGCTNEALQLDTMNSGSPGVFPWFGPYDDTRCRDITIRDCKFENVLNAIGSHSAPAGVNVNISGCVVNGSKGPAIKPNGYLNLVVENCQFNGCDLAFRGPVNGVVFRKNSVYSPTTAGVDFALCSAVEVSDNLFVGAPYTILGAPSGTVANGNRTEASRIAAPACVAPSFADRLDFDTGAGPAAVPYTYVFAGATGCSVPVSTRDSIALMAIASGTSPLQYQWYRDGRPISGATSASFAFQNAAAVGGVFCLRVSNTAGTATSAPIAMIPSVTTKSPASVQLRNLSVRAFLTGGQPLSVGYVTQGKGEKTAIVRGIGPGLRGFGVADAAADLQIVAYDSVPDRLWTAARWDAYLSGAFATVGAFDLQPGSTDVAAVTNLPQGGGTFDVTAGADGVALVELYDASPEALSSFVNLSAMAKVSDDSAMIAGFSLAGTNPGRFLIRAVGPGLKGFGVEAPAGSVTLELCDSNGLPIVSNSGWLPMLADVMASAGAFPLKAGSLDAALVVELEPGQNYTAVARSVAGQAGSVLIELYLLP